MLIASLKLPKTIFSFADEPPTWPSDMEEDLGLESVSEPDAEDVDVEYPSSPEPDAEPSPEQEPEGELRKSMDKELLSSKVEQPAVSNEKVGLGVTIEEIDGTETPGPHSRFPIREDEDEEDEQETNIGAEADEDEWVVDPLRTPSTSSSPVPLPTFHTPSNGRVVIRSQPRPPAVSKSSSRSSTTITKDLPPSPATPPPPPHPIPIQFPRTSSHQEQYPFPLSSESESESPPRSRRVSGLGHGAAPATGSRSANLKGRDGGRTKSGGVRGVRLVE